MTYVRSEIEQFIEEEDVKFIRLAFVDVFGRQKNLSIMRSELERAFDYGVAFDSTHIAGFNEEGYSELVLRPEVETIAVLPWRPDRGRVVRMFCSIERPDGTPFEADSRAILKRAIADAKQHDVVFSFGSEMEFYLFQRDERGEATKIPFDTARYMDVSPLDKGENFRRQVCLTLEQMGIQPKDSHHEEGPGQNEIDFQVFDPLSAADAMITFRFVVNTIAASNGLCADFSPRPLVDQPGNGMRINMTAHVGGQKSRTRQVLAGLLEHIYESTLFYNPDVESYRRFGHDGESSFISCSEHNRTRLARMRASFERDERVELCSPDSTCNPYIAYALAIWSALDGIERDLTLSPSVSCDVESAVARTGVQRIRLPKTLEEARTAAGASKFVASRLPHRVIQCFLDPGERR